MILYLVSLVSIQVAISLTAYSVATPGIQVWQSFVGGVLLGVGLFMFKTSKIDV